MSMKGLAYMIEYEYMESYSITYKEHPCDPDLHVFMCDATDEYAAIDKAQDEIGEHIIIVEVV